jgi:rRNA-processing protein FCF1
MLDDDQAIGASQLPLNHITLFVDTNAFIQLRDLKDLPWPELFPEAKKIDIVVASCVIEELDRFKVSNNARKRDRARLALKLIETASKNNDFSLVVRETPFRIQIVISNTQSPDWTRFPRLDPTKPDDQLVAETATHSADAAVFSHDTGPRIRARLANILAFEPLEDWHLPQEKTDDQRKISEMERRLERALSTYPKILVSLDSVGDCLNIERTIPILSPIDPHRAERLVAAYLAGYPMERLKPRGDELTLLMGGFFEGYSEHDIQQYEKDFANFRNRVRDYFESLHEMFARAAHVLSIPYTVKNDSAVSASGLRIETVVTGDAILLSDIDAASQFVGSLSPPNPPKKPERRYPYWARGLEPSADLTRYLANKSRDPTKFIWFVRPTQGSRSSALQCEDFRATRTFNDEAILLIKESIPFAGVLTLHISATNLPAPVNVVASLAASKRETTWSDESVLNLLPPSVAGLLRRVR